MILKLSILYLYLLNKKKQDIKTKQKDKILYLQIISTTYMHIYTDILKYANLFSSKCFLNWFK